MRETVEGFEARTGLAYQPLIAPGVAFTPMFSCPTVFRYAGPCGMREGLNQTIRWLGPTENESVLVADAPVHADAAGATWFGTLAILQPLRLSPVRAIPRSTLGDQPPLVLRLPNHPVATPVGVVWIPPTAFHLNFDALAEPEQVVRAIPDYEGQRRRIQDDLMAYVEELAAMAATGASGPGQSWCAVSEARRREWLAECGVSPRWTRPAPLRRVA
jgi:hypothetical protein